MTFEEWEQKVYLEGLDRPSAKDAWEAATLAERERCAEEVLYRLRGDVTNFLGISDADVSQYYSGRMDALEEVADAIRNP